MRTLGGIRSERLDPAKVMQAKYLGVTLPHDQAWRSHIDSVIAKAYLKLGFVKRNLRGAPVCSQITAYFALVRAGMEYAAPILDPYFRRDIDALEKVQRKAARWMKSQYSYNVRLLTELKWAPLADWRCIIKLCLLHKIHMGAVNLNLRRDFSIGCSTLSTRTGPWANPDGLLVNHELHRPPKKDSSTEFCHSQFHPDLEQFAWRSPKALPTPSVGLWNAIHERCFDSTHWRVASHGDLLITSISDSKGSRRATHWPIIAMFFTTSMHFQSTFAMKLIDTTIKVHVYNGLLYMGERTCLMKH